MDDQFLSLFRIFFFILGIFMNVAPAHAGNSQPLKVLTLNFNAEVLPEDGNYHFRDRRFAEITKWITEQDPDVVFFVEGWNYHQYSSVIQAIAEAVGYDYHYRLTMGFPGLLYDSDGVIAKKKYQMSQRQNKKLPHSAPSIGDGVSWVIVTGGVSQAVGARLNLEDGTPMYVYSGHLIGKTQAQRDDQISAMNTVVRKHVERNGEDWSHSNVLLGGDFNSTPDASGIKALQENGYHETFGEAHPGSTACTLCNEPQTAEFNPMTIAPGQYPAQNKPGTNDRIDYIFARGPTVQTLSSTITFTNTLSGIWMSDHYGVFSTISLGSRLQLGGVPNPIQDNPVDSNSSYYLGLKNTDFNCAGKDECWSGLAAVQGSAMKGLTIFNDGSHSIKIQISGKGQIFPTNNTKLEPGEITSFFFEPGKHYQYNIVQNGSERGLSGAFTTIYP